MPRKRRNNISLMKQKKAIETRLIQISLIMDDYVYKQREIPESDAISYTAEIASLKSKCNNDQRSLQVIEKLTRCMKAIIIEHRKITKNVYYDLNNEKNMFKPDHISKASSGANFGKNNLTVSLPKENNAVPMEVNHCSAIINLCEESNSKDNQDTSNTIKNNVENESISDFIVVHSKDIFPPPSNTDPGSILNNYQDILSQDLFNTHTQGEDLINDIDHSQNTPYKELTNENQHVDSLRTYPDTSNNTEMDCSQSILTDPSFVENRTPLSLKTQVENTPTSQKVINQCKSNENDVKTKTLPKGGGNLPNINKFVEKEHLNRVNLTASKISDFHLDNMDMPVYSVLKPTAIITDTGNGEVTKANKKAPRKRNVNTKSQENCTTKEVKRKPRMKKDVEHPKTNYKDKLINENSIDLSWIENIKYVREISTAEIHTRTKDLSHNFWDNYSLPNDWDDSEFEYNIIINGT